MHLEKCTITMWEINTVSPSNYRKFLGLYPNRPFSQYYSFFCRCILNCSRRYTSSTGVVLLVNSDCALRKTCAVGVFQKVTYISININMKNMRKLYYLVMISVASILTAHARIDSEEWDVVDFGNDCAVGLQEHLECRFIPLETKDSVLLKDLYRVCWVDDRIFVFDRSDEINALFVFSDQGNFTSRISFRTKEYLYLTHFFVDEKERILTLVDFGGTATIAL